MTFDEEFNGTSLDTTKWANRYPGVRNQATNTPDAVSVANGDLALTTYTTNGTNYTGMIGTQGLFSQAQGYFEASVKMTNAPGNWSAFWLQSPTLGTPQDNPAVAGTEIDVVEHRQVNSSGTNIANSWEGALHYNGYGSTEQDASNTVNNLGLSSGFHLYGLQWSSSGYTMYVDNKVVWTSTFGISNAAEYLILSSEVANSGFGGTVPTAGYGSQASSTDVMYVDYVHAYAAVTPEPAGMALMGAGALLLRRRRKPRVDA